jgi:single-stranded-DNA-specific exonuclease
VIGSETLCNTMVNFQLPSSSPVTTEFQQAVREIWAADRYLSQLLWQRGLQDTTTIAGYLQADRYQPTAPAAFGAEMVLAVARIEQARARQEQVLIWGDFDADGITATSVLWDGLRQFLAPELLSYYIPDRLTESHGLNLAGIDRSHQQGITLIITCDTGSTNLAEIAYAQQLGIDTIVTDHHTLPSIRPPVAAIINPRYLAADHPLFHLSGVAVAYKLVEALYLALPNVPQQPLEYLLDLVAIGLIADLVQLSGDCRYLAQIGIKRLQLQNTKNPQLAGYRPGVAKLLELCKRTGDRPMDISFGIAPRINAISRIHGDARCGVQLLTSQDEKLCNELATVTEQANARRKEVQKNVVAEVQQRVAALDLSTTGVIVLVDNNWAPGVLGLVAGQIAQTYGKPTILLSTAQDETVDPDAPVLARGSARSTQNVDLYELVKSQEHLLNSFGGHPFAAGLSIQIDNLPLFTEAINQRLRQTIGDLPAPVLAIDLIVTIADLGRALFDELKVLEPCGMGNPVPKLLIKNCQLQNARNANITDLKGNKIQYIKTELQITDSTTATFPVVWWGHYADEVPTVLCDLAIELDYNNYKNRCEARIIDLVVAVTPRAADQDQYRPEILDFRHSANSENLLEPILYVHDCPHSWEELITKYEEARQTQQQLALAYAAPRLQTALDVFQRLIGIAKFLARTGQPVALSQLQKQLGISARSARDALDCLEATGFEVTLLPGKQQFRVAAALDLVITKLPSSPATQDFLAIVAEELFIIQYFWQVSVPTLNSVLYPA